MADLLEYGDLVQEVRGTYNPGRLKLQSNGVMFKNIKTGLVDQYSSTDIDKLSWLKRARGNCLKIQLTSGITHRYDGFKEVEYDKLTSFFSTNYAKDLTKVDLSVKGWNWGSVAFEGNNLEFSVGPRMAFEVPLGNVSHATTAKNEVTLEFHANDDAAVSLVELRFHIPTDPNTENDPVEDFYNNVIEKADVIHATGDALTNFPEIQCLTPRGRYDIKLYPTFLQLHGKTFDYKVPYTTILRLFLLPHKDQMFFVMSLDPPIKQGQTRYHFLICLFAKDDEMTVELSLSEEELNEKYDGKLQPEMAGLEYEIVSRIFKAVTKRKITVPGTFLSHQKHHCVSCSYRAATGLLYPLERGFIFVHKPPLHIRFDEIGCVNFARSAGSTKSFDFDIETTSGTVNTFNGIEKEEYGRLYDFVSGKKLRLKNVGGKFGGKNRAIMQDDMEDSDNDGGNPDGYLERMKAEGRVKDDIGGDDDSDDSSDESFNPGDSGSEVAEEYDSNPPTTDSESDAGSSQGGSGDEEKKKKKLERRAAREKERERDRQREKKKSKPSSESKPRKRKSDKDPDAPKRPQSSYMLWLGEMREQIKEENPGFSVVDIARKGGELWKEVTDKSKWEKLAAEAKEKYTEAMAEYKLNKKDEPKSESVEKSKKKKSPKKVVQSHTAGAGSEFKSKEFISSSSGSDGGGGDKEKKPAKKAKVTDEKEETVDVKMEEDDDDSDDESVHHSEEDEKGDSKKKKKPEKRRKSRRQNKKGSDSSESSSAGELPLEEEILKSPTASEKSSSDEEGGGDKKGDKGSGADEGSGKGSGSDAGDN